MTMEKAVFEELQYGDHQLPTDQQAVMEPGTAVLSYLVVEVDEHLYEAAFKIAQENNTTVEQMVADFLRWCIAEENRDDAIALIEGWVKAIGSQNNSAESEEH